MLPPSGIKSDPVGCFGAALALAIMLAIVAAFAVVLWMAAKEFL
jgi:hypothetical protein